MKKYERLCQGSKAFGFKKKVSVTLYPKKLQQPTQV
jgi:hypothetical protein